MSTLSRQLSWTYSTDPADYPTDIAWTPRVLAIQTDAISGEARKQVVYFRRDNPQLPSAIHSRTYVRPELDAAWELDATADSYDTSTNTYNQDARCDFSFLSRSPFMTTNDE